MREEKKEKKKNREIRYLKAEIELLKIENKTADLNLQDFSPSQVSYINYYDKNYGSSHNNICEEAWERDLWYPSIVLRKTRLK